MTEHHRATPEQWAALEEQSAPEYDNTILELRARVEALEASARIGQLAAPANTSPPATRLHSYKVGKAEPIEDWSKGHMLVNPTPTTEDRPGGLVQRVAKAVAFEGCTAYVAVYGKEARAAIREVAEWLRAGRMLHAAELLEQEADRG